MCIQPFDTSRMTEYDDIHCDDANNEVKEGENEIETTEVSSDQDFMSTTTCTFMPPQEFKNLNMLLSTIIDHFWTMVEFSKCTTFVKKLFKSEWETVTVTESPRSLSTYEHHHIRTILFLLSILIMILPSMKVWILAYVY